MAAPSMSRSPLAACGAVGWYTCEQSGVPVSRRRGLNKVGIVTATVSQRERLQRIDADRRERFGILDRMREAFKDVPTEEIEREVKRAYAEVKRAYAEVKRENLARRAANSSRPGPTRVLPSGYDD